ncbi:hypothetical protein EDD17DRAFT_1517582 [Pisolithus thermaeus]|nr:hypothetical protein EDD17DRAFT_1517582 [Pisolithus thermaeus]
MYYSEDNSTTKFLVAAVWVLDTLHLSLSNQLQHSNDFGVYRVVRHSQYVSILVNSFVITIVQLFFAHKIYHMCRHKLRWLVTAPIILLVLFQSSFSMGLWFFPTAKHYFSNQAAATTVVTLINDTITYTVQTRLYTATPAVATILLAEVLNTVSLCVLCMKKAHTLQFQVVIAEFALDVDKIVAWTMAMNFLTPRHQSLGSSLQSDLGVNSVHFANSSKVSGDTGSSKDEVKQIDKCKVNVIDIPTRETFDEPMTLQRLAEMVKSLFMNASAQNADRSAENRPETVMNSDYTGDYWARMHVLEVRWTAVESDSNMMGLDWLKCATPANDGINGYLRRCTLQWKNPGYWSHNF